MPSNEQAYRQGADHPTPTLGLLVGDAPIVTSLQPLSHFALLILMSATLNRVVQYTLRGDKSHQAVVPWSSTSPYTALGTTLLRIRQNFPINQGVNDTRTRPFPDNAKHQQIVGPLMYARALFHLSGCLLHHPFLLQQRIFNDTSRVPLDFLDRAWTSSRSHAEALSRLQDEQALDCYVTVSSFRGYCIMVAGSIHLLYLCDKRKEVQRSSLQHYNDGLNFLQDMSRYWKAAARMVSISTA